MDSPLDFEQLVDFWTQLKKQAGQWVGKLNDQDEGKKKPGRKLSDGGVRAKFYREACQAHL
jgi:hypothetical protein